mgnify:FL=1
MPAIRTARNERPSRRTPWYHTVGKDDIEAKEETPMKNMSTTTHYALTFVVAGAIIIIRCGDSPGALLVV